MSFEHQSQAFSDALDFLYSFINFEKKKQDRYMASKLDSTRPLRFMGVMGDPHTKFPVIHVAGTKGKGSVSALCAYALRASGLRVGLFTSPHLVDFRERIRILTPEDPQGFIPEKSFVAIIDDLKPIIAAGFPDITWFEVLTAVSFAHFAREEVDIAVIEVGLGGRLDATNVVTPLVSVITSLSLDHTQFLGNTLGQIAFEKGGIIKPGVPAVVAPQPQEAIDKLQEIGLERESPISFIQDHWSYSGGQSPNHKRHSLIDVSKMPVSSLVTEPAPLEIALLGDHQIENGVVALGALSTIREQVPALSETAVREGFKQVQWNGRLQTLRESDERGPAVLVDCAHNPDSALKLYDALTSLFTYRRLWLVLGAPADKDVEGMLKVLLPITDQAIFTTASHPRSITPTQLVEMSQRLGFDGTPIDEIDTAVAHAIERADNDDLICVTGSIIVVGDLLNRWERLQSVIDV
ncbi:MAG: folylpolyglutamate synthase/dihydrofolate synthase family protein [Chloroflexota bacterium]